MAAENAEISPWEGGRSGVNPPRADLAPPPRALSRPHCHRHRHIHTLGNSEKTLTFAIGVPRSAGSECRGRGDREELGLPSLRRSFWAVGLPLPRRWWWGAGRERWPRLLQCGSASFPSLSRGLNANGVSVQARPVDPVPLLGAQGRNMVTWCLGREEGET